MTTYWWIREHGNGAICHGTIPDGAYDDETCIVVPDRPSNNHVWDNETRDWELSRERALANIRAKRDPELARTDKYVLRDYFDKFTPEQQAQILEYREALRTAPNKDKAEDMVMPKPLGIIGVRGQ